MVDEGPDGRSRFDAWATRVRAAVARVDPCDDPTAEPLSLLAVLALSIACAFSAWMFLRWKYQPMQDLGHHMALAAVVADYDRPGSLYHRLYEPLDRLAANSLLYSLAGPIGRLVGVTRAVRGCVVFYLVGVPFANLFALRTFGRSAWGALLAVPLVYGMSYVAGFANLLFAAPFMVLALPLFHRMLERPSAPRVALASAAVLVVFLSHAHAWLWTGALLFLLTLFVAAQRLFAHRPFASRARGALVVGGAALAAVLPSLVLFARWYRRTFGEGQHEGTVLNATGNWSNKFGATFKPLPELFTNLSSFALKTTQSDHDLKLVVSLGLLVGAAVVFGRAHRWRKPPVMEAAFALTFLSYFFLPEGLQGHDVLGSRQIGISLWFLPAIASPIPARASRLAHALVALGIVYVTGAALRDWRDALVRFEQTEAHGLDEVMLAAPPGLRLHYVKSDPDSAVFTWRPFWHVEKMYMSERLGYVADTPGILSTSAIRYRPGLELHRVTDHGAGWVRDDEIWSSFDLILLRRWTPSASSLREAERRGERIKKVGDWELWRSKQAKPAAW